MKIITFAKRNFKELVRDPMSLVFGIALPLFFLVMFQQFNIPTKEYSIENFAPSIVIFSYAFISLFTAQLVSKDRASSLLTRLFSSPMRPLEYIAGYTIALIPVAIIQNVLFYIVAMLLGLNANINVLFTMLISLPISLLFIGLGILIGCITNDKQSPALGSLVVQLVAFTSGMWFPIEIAGGVFKIVCKTLPFSYSIDLSRGFLAGNYDNCLLSILIIILYIIGVFILSSYIFKKKMISDNK